MFGLRDERTTEARRNQRIVLPVTLVFFVIGVIGLLLHSTVLTAVGMFAVLACGLAWRWA